MRYGKIESRVWNDEKFITLTPMQQRLFLYTLTCPHGNLIGLYVLKKEYIIGDLKSLPKDLDKDLRKLCESSLIRYDFATSVIFIKNYLKHNPVTNPNQRKAARKILIDLPKSQLVRDFASAFEGLSEGLDLGLPEGLSKPETETETETETEKRTEAKNPPAKKPSKIPADFMLTEKLIEFAKSQGINGNVQQIFDQFKDHHKNKGTLGLDWEAGWRTWVRNEIKFNSGKSNQSFTDKAKAERDTWMRERGLQP